MTIATSQLATAAAQRDALRQAANEQTIANFAPTVARMQAERIAELEEQLAKCNAHLSNCQDTGNYAGMVNEELKEENAALHLVCDSAIKTAIEAMAENAALRAVAGAAEWYNDMEYGLTCPICDNSPRMGHSKSCPYTTARAAGYLPAEGVSS